MKTIVLKYILFAAVILLSHLAKAQLWPKSYSGNNWGNIARQLMEDIDKGYLFCGQITAYDYQSYQGSIIKTDINGNQLWIKKIGTGAYDCAIFNIRRTLDNGYIICGSTSKYDKPYVDADAFLMKLNACGEKQWCTVFRNPGANYGLGVVQDVQGNYTSLIQYYTANYDSLRITLVKLDTDGMPLWVKHQAQYGQPGFYNEEAEDLLLTSDGNYLITGGCQDPSEKPFWILSDTTGTEIWNLRWGGLYGYAWHSVEDRHGNFYAGGQATSPAWGGGFTPSLFKLGKQGNPLYHTYLMGDTLKGGGAGPVVIIQDTLLAFGTAWALKGAGVSDGESDVLLSDTLGNLIHRRCMITNPQGIEQVIKTYDNKIVAMGNFVFNLKWKSLLWKMDLNLEDDTLYTQPRIYDSLCPYPIVSDTIDIDCTLYTKLEELPTQNQYESTIEIWPNPGSSSITIKPHMLGKLGDELKVIDLQGKEVKTIVVNSISQEYLLNIQDLPDGFFTIQHCRQRRLVSTGKLIVKH